MLVGALFASPNGNFIAGSTYVVFGHGGSFAPTLVLNSLNGSNGFRIDGAVGNVSGKSIALPAM